MSDQIATWWEELSAAALLGTARRRLPPSPSEFGPARRDASREVVLLDAAALGSAVRRAGVLPTTPQGVEPAAADSRPLAPPRAVHLLELLLHQSPVGRSLAVPMVGSWLEAADARGARAPHHLLPALLDLATQHASLRAATLSVGDARAAWLVGINPAWDWPAETVPADPAPAADPSAWARESRDRRTATLAQVRGADPAAGRALVLSTWDTDAAPDRAALLAALRTGVGPDDEPLLERALDDRSAKVREVAAELLDALPGSARAARHAARLRPLIQVKGLLRKSLEVELPPEPDEAGTRDGLARPKKVGSVRGWWLQRLAAGSPLEVWTEATGTDPASTWSLVTQRDARVGIVEAVLARRDAAWAAAIAVDVWHPELLGMLPRPEMEVVAGRQLKSARTTEQVVSIVRAVPTPWGPAFSRAVLDRLMLERAPGPLISPLVVQLATGLDPTVRPALEKWRDRLDGAPRDRLSRICQYLVLVPEIPEAFS